MDNLVNYSDSESDCESTPSGSPSAKRFRLPSESNGSSGGKPTTLPSANKLDDLLQKDLKMDLKLTRIRPAPTDSPDMHGGRVRSFPHEEGNWATHVYVPLDVSLVMDSLLHALKDVPSVKTLPLSDLHISLSRTVPIRHHWIPDFEGRLRKVCDSFPRFSVSFSGVDVFVNDERTRTFLSLMVDCGFDQCSKLVGEVDDLFRSFDLPPFYEDQRFHASFAWCLGDEKDRLVRDVLPAILDRFNASTFSAEDDLSVPMDVPEIRMKTGKKLYRFPLRV